MIAVCFLVLSACVPDDEVAPETVEQEPEVPSPEPPTPETELPSLSCTPFIKGGYTDKQSYFPGETMTVYFDSKGAADVCRLTLYTVSGDSVYSVPSQMPLSPAISKDASQFGYGFPKAAVFEVPELKSGVYLLDRKIPFIIKTREEADLLIVYPSNTANAYAESGGKSLYSLQQRPPSVSFHRPIPLESFSSACLKWFVTLPEFRMAYIADVDMDDAENLSSGKVIIIPGHSEYWTLKARRNFDAFVDAGGNALILSGNTMWWQVRYSEDQSSLICYKDIKTDPVSDPRLKTINWNEPSLEYSILSSIGADFTYGGYGLKSDAGWNGYRITMPSSPLFEGTGLEQNDVISLPTVEYDGAPILGYDEGGYPVLDEDALGFDRIELLGFDKGFRVQETTGTFIVFRKKPDSGIIVNTASCNWCSSNGMGGLSGDVIKKITYNAIHKLLNDGAVFSD